MTMHSNAEESKMTQRERAVALWGSLAISCLVTAALFAALFGRIPHWAVYLTIAICSSMFGAFIYSVLARQLDERRARIDAEQAKEL